MKRIKLLSYLLILFVTISLQSCDITENEYSKSLEAVSISFIYPQDINQNYRFVFNGKEGNVSYISSDNHEGLLEIYEKGSNTLVYKNTIAVNNNEIKLIRIGSDINLYDKSNYISFTPSFIFTGDADSIVFNEQPIENNKINYLPLSKKIGRFKVYVKHSTSPIYTSPEDITLSNGMFYSMLQMDNDFIEIPKDNEPNPEKQFQTKVRFLYLGSTNLKTDNIILKLYRTPSDWDWSSSLSISYELKLEKGKFSDYVLFDLEDPTTNFYIFSIDTDKGSIIPFDQMLFASTPLLNDDGMTARLFHLNFKSVYKALTRFRVSRVNFNMSKVSYLSLV